MAKKNEADELRQHGGKLVVRKIRDWGEYQRVVAGTEHKNWAFRGQADARWPLFSSISRYLRDFGVHPDAWAGQEERIDRIFRRKAHLFLDHVPDESDTFQWLGLMQHHGAPTRLIDFTWSPFVAAFFALERATVDAAVWAVFMPEVRRTSHEFPGLAKRLSVDQLGLRNPGAYARFYLRNQVPFVTGGEPLVMNRRLIAQSGTFFVPGVLDLSLDEILVGYPHPSRTIVKFVLDTERLRSDGMLALYNMNMTHATLFPDLDGLARSMAYELEFHWAYDPKTMKVSPGYEV